MPDLCRTAEYLIERVAEEDALMYADTPPGWTPTNFTLLLNRLRDLAGLDPLTIEVMDPEAARLHVRSVLRSVASFSESPGALAREVPGDREVWITEKQAAEEASRQTGEDSKRVYERARKALRAWRNKLPVDSYCKKDDRRQWLYRQDAIQAMIDRRFRKRST